LDEPAEFVVALLEGDIHPAPEEFSTDLGDLEAENIGTNGGWVDSGGAFTHRHEVEESVDFSLADEEFIEGDPGIEPALFELIDGDLGEDLLDEQVAFFVFERVDDVVHQVLDGLGVEGNCAVLIFDADLSAGNAEDWVNLGGVYGSGVAFLFVFEFGDEPGSADFGAVLGAGGEGCDEYGGAQDSGVHARAGRLCVEQSGGHCSSDTGVVASGSTVM